jgi:hypothetical protein
VCKPSFLGCHGFGGVLGPWQPGWNCPTNKSAGGGVRQITFGLDAWEGIAFGSAWNALGLCGARERQSDCQGFFGKQQFIISAASWIAICKISLFFWPQNQQQQLHHHMEKRKVDQEEFTATSLCAHAIPLYQKKQLLLLYTALLPKVHWMEMEAVLRDHGNGKLSCVVTLCVSV